MRTRSVKDHVSVDQPAPSTSSSHSFTAGVSDAVWPPKTSTISSVTVVSNAYDSKKKKKVLNLYIILLLFHIYLLILFFPFQMKLRSATERLCHSRKEFEKTYPFLCDGCGKRYSLLASISRHADDCKGVEELKMPSMHSTFP